MHGFLLRIIHRQLRRLALATTLGMAVVTTTAVLTSGFGDSAIPETDVAIENAALLTATGCENLGEKPTGVSRAATGDSARVPRACAGGDVQLGDGVRRGPGSANRATGKQRN